MKKSLLIRSIIIGSISGVVLYGIMVPQIIDADVESQASLSNSVKIVENSRSKLCVAKSSYKVVKTIKMVITAYSSTKDQTDDTPFITASGKKVVDGIIANNMLSFGTKVKIPEIYGDKIFTVEDKMHQRKGKYHIDIWFPEYKEAKEFGARLVNVEILES